ncbi:MAG TPA: HD domain-containing protein [Candidatus Saccharimonadia bacterium]|nr:HD domain-containing protein [Candidatus Saccharimonadia bacterium]
MKLLNISYAVLQEKLDQYLDSDANFKAVFEYTQRRFEAATNLTAHNWAHCRRDTINAIVIGEAEKADMGIVLPAACMHDIGFLYGATGKTHGSVGADKLAGYLKEGGINYSIEAIEKLASCLRTHKGSMHQEKPESLEAKVVADADMLEKFGPFGVYQNIRTFGEFNRPLESNLERASEIFNLTLETPTGQRLAEPGRQFVADFYRELQEAAAPYGIRAN